MSIDALLFDLDGTLVDTAPDLVAVLNRLLREHNLPPAPFAVARNEVSNGAVGLIRLGFGADLPPARYENLRARFLELYSGLLCERSRLFLSLESFLELARATACGIVTNKPQLMTVPLIERLGLANHCGCVVSGDQLPQKKPHPAPLLHAAEELGVAAERCIYVGDALRDIEAGRAAGMTTVAAAYGYIRPGDDVRQWGADFLVRHPSELRVALQGLVSRAAGNAA